MGELLDWLRRVTDGATAPRDDVPPGWQRGGPPRFADALLGYERRDLRVAVWRVGDSYWRAGVPAGVTAGYTPVTRNADADASRFKTLEEAVAFAEALVPGP